MTTRRTFLTGLMGTAAVAAIGPAQAVPAQPVADFLGVLDQGTVMFTQNCIWRSDGPLLVRWSEGADPTDWRHHILRGAA